MPWYPQPCTAFESGASWLPSGWGTELMQRSNNGPSVRDDARAGDEWACAGDVSEGSHAHHTIDLYSRHGPYQWDRPVGRVDCRSACPFFSAHGHQLRVAASGGGVSADALLVQQGGDVIALPLLELGACASLQAH